jgi:hypothetical protein
MSHEYVRAPGPGQVHRAQAAYDPNQIYTLQSIEAIQNWVDHEANSMKYDLNDLRVIAKLQDTSVNAFKGFERMHSSAGQVDSQSANDCLIHSLLTAISPIFRKLDSSNKNIIAYNFRRIVLLTLLKNEPENNLPYGFTTETITDMKERIPSTNFLTDEEMKYLLNRYRFNVYIYGPARILPAKLPAKLPARNLQYSWRLIQSSQDNNSPLILLYNHGNIHFESIRNPKGDKYLFTLNDIASFQSIKDFIPQHIVNLHSKKSPCKFSKYDIIQHNQTQKIYMVYQIGFNEGNSNCKTLIVFELTPEVIALITTELAKNHSIANIINNVYDFATNIFNISDTINSYTSIKYANTPEILQNFIQSLTTSPSAAFPEASPIVLSESPSTVATAASHVNLTAATLAPPAATEASPAIPPAASSTETVSLTAQPLLQRSNTPAALSASSTQIIIAPTITSSATINLDGTVTITTANGSINYDITENRNTPLTFTVKQIIPSK